MDILHLETNKINKMKKLHFSLGEDAGKRLMEIAQEHLIYNLDPNKAMRTITESLIGCSTELALKILTGNLVLIVDSDGQTIHGEQRNETHSDFPYLNIAEWHENEHSKIGDDGRMIYRMLERLEMDLACHSTNFDFSITVDYKAIVKYAESGDLQDLMAQIEDRIDNSPIVGQTKDGISIARNYLIKTYKTWGVMEWLEKMYPDIYKAQYLEMGHHDVVSMINYKLTNLINSNIDELRNQIDSEFESLNNHIAAIQEIDRVIEVGIEPVNIKDNYSAGWLAPNGDYYALNGEVSNLLHIQISDALVKKGVIPTSIEGEKVNPDRWLEENGWVKIHGDWILYDGYSLGVLGLPIKHLTEEQKKSIYEYGQLCCSGKLYLGYNKQFVSAARFNMTDKFMLHKYFEL